MVTVKRSKSAIFIFLPPFLNEDQLLKESAAALGGGGYFF